MQNGRGSTPPRTTGRVLAGAVLAPPMLHRETVRVLTSHDDHRGVADVVLRLPLTARERELSIPVRLPLGKYPSTAVVSKLASRCARLQASAATGILATGTVRQTSAQYWQITQRSQQSDHFCVCEWSNPRTLFRIGLPNIAGATGTQASAVPRRRS